MTTQLEFELSNSRFIFAPHYYPKDVDVNKERNLSEQGAICEGEDVTDIGSKNRVVGVTGYLLQHELPMFHRLCELGEPLDLISLPWSGEVLLKKPHINGPVALDVESGDWMYEYDLELKSTGADEYGDDNHGVIDDGFEADYNGPAWGL